MIHADIELRNSARPDLKAFLAHALVDTGSAHLCVPQHVAIQLGLEVTDERQVVLSDGTTKIVDYVGPISIRFGNRQAHVGALVMGKQVLFGLIPMTDLDLVIDPRGATVTVNPQAPNIAVSGEVPPVLGMTH